MIHSVFTKTSHLPFFQKVCGVHEVCKSVCRHHSERTGLIFGDEQSVFIACRFKSLQGLSNSATGMIFMMLRD